MALSESIAQVNWRLFFLSRDKVQAQLTDVSRVCHQLLAAGTTAPGHLCPAEKPARARPYAGKDDVAALVKTTGGHGRQCRAFDAS